ncbi:probable peroxisomal acyl-coenzyme A oxidase 1 [Teleopsis dalmanni]|uniref:probable peroxisomal acyl-coenzyme A oxidase 1 n=1 Tax=Teleopsis dalmanni TaxID=139649 RepID=UPI0018CF2270|nr:probable peroxisomal acyl-coenzyme A oxidase 1 [Teleopsis dalmanni]
MDTMKVKENVDLQRARQNTAVDSGLFAEWWAGGRDALQKRRDLEKLFFDDPAFNDEKHISYMSHKELYEHSVAKATKFLTKLRAWHKEQERVERAAGKPAKGAIQSMYDFRMILSGSLGTSLFQQSFPLRLHFSMFLPTLLGQGTEEQQRTWLNKAWNLDGMIGTYAQTELGHGTFLRGLETRADYDIEREEFILNTPTLTAYKWWPGGLGHTANVVVIMAQLYIKGKHCGLHPFLVRIRSEDTHEPVPGVDVGEIGTKIGINGVNNGYLGFTNVRISRTQMLMKNAQVLPDGTFVKGPEPLLLYGTMVFTRVMIVRDVMFGLLQAATIATRYSFVRRQSPIAPDQPEPQIIDHLTQQQKVFPQIAKGVFFRIAADYVWKLYQEVAKELDAGNRSNLAELHALSCCLKAVCSHESTTGIEILRRACGGQGYLTSANFSQIYGVATAACTYEGENTVLLLQTARFLVKNCFATNNNNTFPKTLTYLGDTKPLNWSNDLVTLVRALEIAASQKVQNAAKYQNLKRVKNQIKQEVAANLAGIKLTEAATLHGRAFLARVSYEEIHNLKNRIEPTLYTVLIQLLEIFLLDMFLSSLGDVLRSNTITSEQLSQVELRFEQVLGEFRDNAIAVVDGFDFHDRVLGSTLGCYDGRVYERLMEEAKKSPLNQETVNSSFHKYLKPFMQNKL